MMPVVKEMEINWRERAILETMRLNHLDRETAERVVDNFQFKVEKLVIEGEGDPSNPPQGIFNRP